MKALLCVKTPKGIVEVEQRTYRLPVRARQVLVMIDGKRDHAALAAMFPGDGLLGILETLMTEGFITPLVGKAPPSPEAAASVVTSAAAAPADEEERYAMARNFMLNTTAAFVGIAGSSLSSRLETAASIDELRHLFQEWREAIRLSHDGREQVADLENRLAALLS